MSFTASLLIIVALAAVALALICVHLLARLELLERAVHGGLEAPTTRLSREQFERRFAVARARSYLAASVTTGIVIVFGPEAHDDHELVRTLANLSRRDHVFVHVTGGDGAAHHIAGLDAFAELESALDPAALGVTTTPFAFVVDDARIRAAQPLVTGDELITLLRERA